jgi:hypothetical protein
MEQRYAALIDAHGKAVAEKQKLAQENETLREVGCTAGLCRQAPPPTHTPPAQLLGPPFPARPRALSHAASQDLTSARQEAQRLQTALAQRDSELERRNVEMSALRRDKATLDKLLQQRQAEAQELQTRLQAATVCEPAEAPAWR